MAFPVHEKQQSWLHPFISGNSRYDSDRHHDSKFFLYGTPISNRYNRAKTWLLDLLWMARFRYDPQLHVRLHFVWNLGQLPRR